MKCFIKGAVIMGIASGMIISFPKMVTSKAPISIVVSEQVSEENTAQEQILIDNPIIKDEEEIAVQAFCCTAQSIAQKEIQEKFDTLEMRRKERKEEEKRLEKIKKQKALARQKAKKEAQLKRKIKACCGVAVGSNDRVILERIVEAEAGGEDFRGKVLVANVILNRVKNKSFPSTVAGVVFSHRGSRYQFSPISDGRYYRVKVSEGTKKAVEAALQGEDRSQGALYFMQRSYASSSNVSWFDRALTCLFRHGCHEFFK